MFSISCTETYSMNGNRLHANEKTSGFPAWSSDMLQEGQPPHGRDVSNSRTGMAGAPEVNHVTGNSQSPLLKANKEMKDGQKPVLTTLGQ